MNRRNGFLTVALLAQVILIVLLASLRATATTVPGKPIFGAVKATDITQVTLQDPTGKTIDLTRNETNWVMPQAGNYPADATKITAFLDKVLKIETGRLIAQTPASYARLQVADNQFAQKVVFKLANGDSHVLLIGTSPSAGSVHVRADGAKEVYLVDGLSSSDAAPDAVNWINPTYIAMLPDQVTAVDITNANGSFSFAKDAANAWQMKGLNSGETFDAAKITSMVGQITPLSLIRPLGQSLKPEFGLTSPAATITLTLQPTATVSIKPVVIQIGMKDSAENSYTVASNESPYYVRVGSYELDAFVTSSRQSFLKLPPTAVPTPTSTPAQ
ncbi:MAG: DUF4340 domain-containing protein [Chloroflexi bacterium]|nr:DUF4340 domain-containing protein [Chloroflexota bacterium]MCL5275190.1 DUF4340 domain-containing protein [Chloroflexota bacterium]